MNNNSLQVIQPGTSFSAATPLFLIHDAGGTLYSYYSLGDLQRPVYGIVNPHFDSGAPWEGGISEMAQSYYTMIRRQVRKGDVLLGGWSLGGLLAFQVSWIFAQDPDVNVSGIVMIDSPFPQRSSTGGKIIMPPLPQGTSFLIRKRLEATVRQALKMLDKWTVPDWSERGPPADHPPPTIMLHAKDKVPTDAQTADAADAVAMVDKLRDDGTLGWGALQPPFLKESRDVPGHHFNIFTPENIDTLTLELQKACISLASGEPLPASSITLPVESREESILTEKIPNNTTLEVSN